MANAVLQCPKCGAGMVSFKRSGIALEECANCRGVFLRHGQLERLIGRRGAATSGPIGHPMASPYEGRHRRD